VLMSILPITKLRKGTESMFRSFIVVSLFMFLVVSNVLAADEGLVAYLAFNEGSGGVAGDSSGRGNNGTIVNAEWVDGVFGKALSFNGVDTYVEIPYNDDFNMSAGITLAAWIKIDHLPLEPAPWRVIINAQKSAYGPYLLQASTFEDRSVYEFSMSLGGEWNWNVSGSEETTEWTHLVGTYDGTASRIYVNTELDAEKEMSGNIDANVAEGVVIGHFYGNDGRWFHGLIDEVAIYNRAISADEIGDMYTGGSMASVNPESKAAVTWGELKIKY